MYIWYTSLISVVTKLNFPFFLALNFLLCSFIISYSLKKVAGFNITIRSSFYLYITPVIIPTIFYFSPRSSISFCFILLGFLTLSIRRKLSLGVLSLFVGFSFHSQYILVSLYILTLYLLSCYLRNLTKLTILRVNLIAAFFLLLFLLVLPYLQEIINSLFSFLPSASIALSKLHYIAEENESSGGFRVTAILSILVYPLLALAILNKYKEKNPIIDNTFLFCMLGIVFFGAVVNIAFIGEPHVAGRLSRFSDYFSMGFLIPYSFYTYNKIFLGKIVALLLCLVAPLIFKTLYINAAGII